MSTTRRKEVAMETAPSSVFAALLGIAGLVVGALINHLLAGRQGVDAAIRERRLAVYKELWLKTDVLPKWPRKLETSRAELKKFSEDLRNWYFNEGGMFLSESSRKAYGALQKRLNDSDIAQGSGSVSGEQYDSLQKRCSKLRTELAHDLLSRKRMFIFSR
jgi:hypothetical protein